MSDGVRCSCSLTVEPSYRPRCRLDYCQSCIARLFITPCCDDVECPFAEEPIVKVLSKQRLA